MNKNSIIKKSRSLFHQDIGAILLRYRMKSGKTQKELADKLGLKTSQYISNMERGICSFKVEYFVVASKMYGIENHVAYRDYQRANKKHLKRMFAS